MAGKPTVYIETTIVSYLTARSSNDPIRRGQQEITKRWWERRRADFELRTSQFVVDEAAAGDPSAATERTAALVGIAAADMHDAVDPFAEDLLKRGALPLKARMDAVHLAVCAMNGIDFLMTWNCRHLANAELWPKIEDVCHLFGVGRPAIVTHYELLGDMP